MLFPFVIVLLLVTLIKISEGSSQFRTITETTTTTTAKAQQQQQQQQQQRQKQSHRELPYESIAGYEPLTLVTDQNAFDLDVFYINEALGIHIFEDAYNIYQYGSYSKPVATITLLEPLIIDIKEDTIVEGVSVDGNEILGFIYKDVLAGSNTIRIQYQASELQSNYLNCHVGGNPFPTTNGCFQTSGIIIIKMNNDTTDDNNNTLILQYQYSILNDNHNERTIQKYTLEAYKKMYICDTYCPYVDYKLFYDYYNEIGSYGDIIISSATKGIKTTQIQSSSSLITEEKKYYGGINFQYAGLTGRSIAFRKTIIQLIIWMFVIRELEKAIDTCFDGCSITVSSTSTNTNTECIQDIVHPWDKAVAYYTGSLEGRDGTHGHGVLLYSHAEKLCTKFNTCTKTGDYTTTTSGLLFGEQQRSNVNIEIFKQFQLGQELLSKRQCHTVRDIKKRIVQLMRIPNIQDTLYYTYKLSQYSNNNNNNNNNNNKGTEEGVIMDVNTIEEREKISSGSTIAAASILPYIYVCNKEDAITLYNNIPYDLNSFNTNFTIVKLLLEKNYKCLNITCNDIGGIINTNTDTYYDNAMPCIDQSIKSTYKPPSTTTTLTINTPKKEEEDEYRSSTFLTNNNERKDGKIIGITVSVGFVLVALIVFLFSYVGPKPSPTRVEMTMIQEVELS